MIEFTVHGTPYPQGSKAAFVDKRGNARMKESSGANLAHWRNAIIDKAIDQRSTLGYTLTGPLRVEVTFRYRMPASRPKADRVHGLSWRSVGADLDKLCRALGDALEIANLIDSDALIAEWSARKIEVCDAWEGAHVQIVNLGYFDGARLDMAAVHA